MPLFYLRRLTGRKRTERADRHLARYLAFIAGATNAGGFIAVRQYTSHMSGVVAAMADNVALGALWLAGRGLVAVLSFLLGAFMTTLFIRWNRARALESEYALPLLVEAVLLSVFAFTGTVFHGGRVLGTIMLLCFTMGMQNAIITKLSNSVIRTTHVTGMITDIGIALGRIVLAFAGGDRSGAASDIYALRLLSSLVALFFVGGVSGAVGFTHAGFLFALPLAVALLLLAAVPVIDDIRQSANLAA